MLQPYRLDIIIPCYNEAGVLPDTCSQLVLLVKNLKAKQLISKQSYIYLIDDGSIDKTWSIIEDLTAKYNCTEGIRLSRNYGHQNALLAGLFSVSGDYVISLDADLQDDINAIELMLSKAETHDVVYAAREKRESDSFFKKYSAALFYKLMDFLACELVPNHADYRLLSRKAIEHLKTFKETNLFLRGLIPLLGFESTIVYYNRLPRTSGESKYSLFKMLALAWNGITSLSIAPLRIITIIGFLVFIVSSFMGLWGLYIRFFTEQAIPGWASTILPIYFIGGIQLLSLGVIGEYIGKIYMETKHRPRYFIAQRTDEKSS
ncbi:MAG: glycosyltransferase family 2 protein [Pseudomonadota bacterium]